MFLSLCPFKTSACCREKLFCDSSHNTVNINILIIDALKISPCLQSSLAVPHCNELTKTLCINSSQKSNDQIFQIELDHPQEEGLCWRINAVLKWLIQCRSVFYLQQLWRFLLSILDLSCKILGGFLSALTSACVITGVLALVTPQSWRRSTSLRSATHKQS